VSTHYLYQMYGGPQDGDELPLKELKDELVHFPPGEPRGAVYRARKDAAGEVVTGGAPQGRWEVLAVETGDSFAPPWVVVPVDFAGYKERPHA
jgi:hypothetical protein